MRYGSSWRRPLPPGVEIAASRGGARQARGARRRRSAARGPGRRPGSLPGPGRRRLDPAGASPLVRHGRRRCSASTTGRSGSWPRSSATTSKAGSSAPSSGEFDVMEMPGLEIGLDVERPLALNDVVVHPARPRARGRALLPPRGTRSSGTCAATAWSRPPRLARRATTSPTRARSWPGASRATSSASSRRTRSRRGRSWRPRPTRSTSRTHAGREPVEIALDGQRVGELGSGDEVEVRFRHAVARLAQVPGSNFYRRMRERSGGWPVARAG